MINAVQAKLNMNGKGGKVGFGKTKLLSAIEGNVTILDCLIMGGWASTSQI